MTYCVGMVLDEGLVLMSDTRTNSGVDNISVFRKMYHWCKPGERVIAISEFIRRYILENYRKVDPDRIRLPLDFDAEALAADLAAFGEEDWTRHFVRDNYEGAWAALPPFPQVMICVPFSNARRTASMPDWNARESMLSARRACAAR